jgi:beta-phosphoglucomutase-like phosphatase (HAD superfamily)
VHTKTIHNVGATQRLLCSLMRINWTDGINMKFKRMVFDFNGVLWWDGHLHIQAWQHFARVFRGRDLSDSEIAVHMHGRTNQHVFSYLMDRNVQGEELRKLIHQKESTYRKLCLTEEKGFTLSPGAVDLLNFLAEQKIPRTIALASERTNLDFFVAHLDLSKWLRLEGIVYDDGNLPGKPAPDVYLRAAQNLGLKPAECVVVEDAYSGIKAAQAVGVGRVSLPLGQDRVTISFGA